jgi:hypothetical protein
MGADARPHLDGELATLLALVDGRRIRRNQRAAAARLLETPDGRRAVERQRRVAQALRAGGPAPRPALWAALARQPERPPLRLDWLAPSQPAPGGAMALQEGEEDPDAERPRRRRRRLRRRRHE